MNLFIDIDGVLLGKSPITEQPVIANHTKIFLEFCLLNFDCYWLTTHCKEGKNDQVIRYLAPLCGFRCFVTNKTDHTDHF